MMRQSQMMDCVSGSAGDYPSEWRAGACVAHNELMPT